jgi:hypothetical protein
VEGDHERGRPVGHCVEWSARNGSEPQTLGYRVLFHPNWEWGVRLGQALPTTVRLQTQSRQHSSSSSSHLAVWVRALLALAAANPLFARIRFLAARPDPVGSEAASSGASETGFKVEAGEGGSGRKMFALAMSTGTAEDGVTDILAGNIQPPVTPITTAAKPNIMNRRIVIFSRVRGPTRP